jgi:regulator of protease activity HflC (stomatin/prohibitin superfamily)
MVTLKYTLFVSGTVLLVFAASILLYGAHRIVQNIRSKTGEPVYLLAKHRIQWRAAVLLAVPGIILLLAGFSLVVVPSGMAGLRVSQFSGSMPGVLYPGTHMVLPLIQHVETYSMRDHIFTAGGGDAQKEEGILRVQSKEGLDIGLAVAVRYRLDPNRLVHIHAGLPQPVDSELIPPVVASTFREIIPNYMVREVFSTRRSEVQRSSSEAIIRRLAADGILVKEVLLRDIVLPPEYAKGLEGLLLKEQENESMAIELEVKEKQVHAAELEAEAQKAREVKRAEGRALTTVIEAKAQADAMQHTLPLKEKQIQQTRLEAEARKEATVKNAEAAAEAKLIDSRAELERQKLMAEAEEHRVRLMAGADAERMKSEAQVLNDNPLLIQKIIAERLSDKVQIMMVPMDGKFFFANDVLRANQSPIGVPIQK